MLRLGVIGLSKGNGHPYSWSAIFNGYDKKVLVSSDLPVIAQYLSERLFPDDAISNAKVTHVWTQDRNLSNHIAKATYIENVVDDYSQMIGEVDAVLLARDDVENHFEMSKQFILAGIPIFIDKPISLTVKETKAIFDMQSFPGQVFTCSAMHYAKEFCLSKDALNELGIIKHISGVVPKSWEKYAIHIIDPVLKILGHQGDIIKSAQFHHDDSVIVDVVWESGVHASFSTLGQSSAPLSLTIIGTKSHKILTFKDSFSAFKASLEAFVMGVNERKTMISEDFILSTIEVLEVGCINR